MKVSVNKDCIGCGACVAVAPSIFKMNQETMKSVVIKQPKTKEEESLSIQAAESCPVDAIKIKK